MRGGNRSLTVAALKQQRLPFHVFVADGGPSVTPEEIKRMAIWQAKVCSKTRFPSILWLDPSLITSAQAEAKPQPYDALAKGLNDCIARIAAVCSKTTSEPRPSGSGSPRALAAP